MKRVALVLLLMTVIISCDSDKVTDPITPIDTANLIGVWDGIYAMTYDAGTDSAQTFEVDVRIAFTNISFALSNDEGHTCGADGSERYEVKERTLEFTSQSPLMIACPWFSSLEGQYTYDYIYDGRSPAKLHMRRSIDRYSWRVDVVQQPTCGTR